MSSALSLIADNSALFFVFCLALKLLCGDRIVEGALAVHLLLVECSPLRTIQGEEFVWSCGHD